MNPAELGLVDKLRTEITSIMTFPSRPDTLLDDLVLVACKSGRLGVVRMLVGDFNASVKPASAKPAPAKCQAMALAKCGTANRTERA